MPQIYRRAIRPLLFRLDPETAHNVVGAAAMAAAWLWPVRRLLARWSAVPDDALRTTVYGLSFPNPVGVAAGFDKTARLYPFLAAAGFGFVEQGTFTAGAQPGNPRPRVFRFAAEGALVNRLGFNNPGAVEAARRIGGQRTSVPRGISIGKSRNAELADAAANQAAALRPLAALGDYVALNVSSPNTPGLRDQQALARLREIVTALRATQDESAVGRRPLLLKLSPDFERADFETLVGGAEDLGLDGLILTNTTLSRDRVAAARGVEGGLSGAPLRARSSEWIRLAYRLTAGRLPIIGVGGIAAPEHALEKILAGASLVQIYTGYIFEGPGLPRAINRGLAAECRRRGVALNGLVGREDG